MVQNQAKLMYYYTQTKINDQKLKKFIYQRSIQIKISIPYKQKRKIKNSRIRNLNAFVDNLQTIYDVYESLEDYSLT